MSPKFRQSVLSAYWLLLTVHLLVPNPGYALVEMGVSPVSVDFSATRASVLAHASTFFVLAVLILWARNRGAALWMLTACGHAVGTEFLQRYVPTRTASLEDAVSNVGGLLLGCAVYLLALKVTARTAPQSSWRRFPLLRR